jgi:hypothetical protein
MSGDDSAGPPLSVDGGAAARNPRRVVPGGTAVGGVEGNGAPSPVRAARWTAGDRVLAAAGVAAGVCGGAAPRAVAGDGWDAVLRATTGTAAARVSGRAAG